MYQLQKVNEMEMAHLLQAQAWNRGFRLGARQKLLLDFVKSGDKIAKVSSDSGTETSTAGNLNAAAKQYKINVRAFTVNGDVYIVNLTLLDAENK